MEPQKDAPTEKSPSEELAEKLLSGWTMTERNCGACKQVPLMRNKDGRDYCVCCKAFIVKKNPQEASDSASKPGGETGSASKNVKTAPFFGVKRCGRLGASAAVRFAEVTSLMQRGMEVAGEGRLGDEAKLERCSLALKRAGEKAAEALLTTSNNTAKEDDFFKRSRDLQRWREESLAEKPSSDAKPCVAPVVSSSKDQNKGVQSPLPSEEFEAQQRLLKHSRKLILSRIAQYNQLLEEEASFSLERDRSLIEALREAIQTLKLLQ